MATGRTRRIQFSKIRFSSPTRRGLYSEGDSPDDSESDVTSGGDPNSEGWDVVRKYFNGVV